MRPNNVSGSWSEFTKLLDLLARARIKFYIYRPVGDEKEIRWAGSSYEDLLAFPRDSRREAGFQLRKVQAWIEPTVWKPFDDVGAGTKEIRINDASGI